MYFTSLSTNTYYLFKQSKSYFATYHNSFDCNVCVKIILIYVVQFMCY